MRSASCWPCRWPGAAGPSEAATRPSAFGRFFLELLRTDTTYRLLGLSRNGWVSLGVMLGAGGWLWLRERHRPPAEAATATGDEITARAAGGAIDPGAPADPRPDRG
jgi:hypothetical protein